MSMARMKSTSRFMSFRRFMVAIDDFSHAFAVGVIGAWETRMRKAGVFESAGPFRDSVSPDEIYLPF